MVLRRGTTLFANDGVWTVRKRLIAMLVISACQSVCEGGFENTGSQMFVGKRYLARLYILCAVLVFRSPLWMRKPLRGMLIQLNNWIREECQDVPSSGTHHRNQSAAEVHKQRCTSHSYLQHGRTR